MLAKRDMNLRFPTPAWVFLALAAVAGHALATDGADAGVPQEQTDHDIHQRPSLQDAASAHRALEARSTSGSTILTL